MMAAMSGIDCVRDGVPLAERTWFKVGGAAQFFAEPTSVDELKSVVERSSREGLHVRLLGGGGLRLAGREGRLLAGRRVVGSGDARKADAQSEPDEFWRASIVALDVLGRPADHPDNAKSARPVAIRLHQRA